VHRARGDRLKPGQHTWDVDCGDVHLNVALENKSVALGGMVMASFFDELGSDLRRAARVERWLPRRND